MNRFVPRTGVGIELRGEDFFAVCAKQFAGRWRLADSLTIPGFHTARPDEAGKLYRQFLRRNGLKAPWTVVALPRSSVLVRVLRFPKQIESELGRAVEYQIDGLHPFEADDVYWSFTPLNWDQPNPHAKDGAPPRAAGEIIVLVAIARKRTIDELAQRFQDCGVPVSQFDLGTNLLVRLVRSAARASAEVPIFVVNGDSKSLEVIGMAPGASLASREVALIGADGATEDALSRELETLRSEMRLEPDRRALLIISGIDLPADAAQAVDLLNPESLVPPKSGQPAGISAREHLVGIAAAREAVLGSESERLNLLPAERRSYEPAAIYAPTYVLSAIVVLLAIALGVRGAAQDWLYSRYLDRETKALTPRIQEIETVEDQNRVTIDRLAALAAARASAAVPLQVLQELTRVLPPDAWLQVVQYEAGAITMTGSAQSATSVLQALSGSEYFEAPQFVSTISRSQDGREGFRIGAKLQPAAKATR